MSRRFPRTATIIAVLLLTACSGTAADVTPAPSDPAPTSPSSTTETARPTPSESSLTSPSPRPSASPDDSTDPDSSPTAPTQFRGTWTDVENDGQQITSSDCDRDGDSTQRLIGVSTSEISYFEPPTGVLRKVVDSFPDRFHGRFAFEDIINDGSDSISTIQFTLREDRSVLIVSAEGSKTSIYKRCPA